MLLDFFPEVLSGDTGLLGGLRDVPLMEVQEAFEVEPLEEPLRLLFLFSCCFFVIILVLIGVFLRADLIYLIGKK